MKWITTIAPGAGVSIALAAAAWWASDLVPHVGKVMMAILLGIVFGNIVRPGPRLSPGVGLCGKTVLSLAIAMLGFKVQVAAMASLGGAAVVVVLFAVAAGMLGAWLGGKLLGYDLRFSLLMGTGNSICGSSAIAAAAPVLRSGGEQIALSLGVINLLGTVGMLALPAVASRMGLGKLDSAFLLGGSLQAVGQVAAAGLTLSPEIGALATSVKMLRILMLIPLMVVLSLLMRREAGRADDADAQGHAPENTLLKSVFGLVPLYLWGFVACGLAAWWMGQGSRPLHLLATLGEILLMIAMAAVGMKIHIPSLLRHAPRAILLGLIGMAAQVATLLGLIALL